MIGLFYNFLQIPKGNIGVQLFTDEIKIIPMGLIEGRTLARVNQPNTDSFI